VNSKEPEAICPTIGRLAKEYQIIDSKKKAPQIETREPDEETVFHLVNISA